MYFDPGTGSMLIQMLLGAIPVVVAFFVGFRKKLFKKKDDVNQVTEQNDQDVTITAEVRANDGFEDIDDD